MTLCVQGNSKHWEETPCSTWCLTGKVALTVLLPFLVGLKAVLDGLVSDILAACVGGRGGGQPRLLKWKHLE